jgi:hypothetical protein
MIFAVKGRGEPMDDLISRQAAIDEVLNLNVENRVSWRDAVIDTIDALPSAQPDCTDCPEYDTERHYCPKYCDVIRRTIEEAKQERTGQWIPCSERLPEYGVSVLTYDGHCFCVEKRIPTIRDEEGEPITGDWWVSDDYDEYDGDYYPNLRDGACIAWMPLPECYRGENDG